MKVPAHRLSRRAVLAALLTLPAASSRAFGADDLPPSRAFLKPPPPVTAADQILNVMDFEALARDALPPAHFGYLATGVDDDRTVARNHDAFSHYEIRAHRFVDVSHVDISCVVFGAHWASPVYLSAIGAMRAFHSDAELAVARAAAGQSIQADGLSSERWYVLEEGRVQLETEGAHEPPRLLDAGDCFGERALLGMSGLPVATALSRTRCLQLRRAIFAPHDCHPTFGQTSLAEFRQPFPFVAQQAEADCGLAALGMLLRCRGLTIDYSELRPLVRTGAQGATLTELQRLGRALGLACTAIRVSQDQLHLVEPPVIAHMAEGHYVVVFQHGPEGVVAGDPAQGIIRLSWHQFGHDFSGHLLLARPREK